MPDISKITLPSGMTYNVKDATARSQIEALSNYTAYAGVTTSALIDGATTNPIVVGGNNVTAKTGMICTYQSKEFIWNGSAWQEFGDLSALGAMAYADRASGSYTPVGAVTGSIFIDEIDVQVRALSSEDDAFEPALVNYTPEGTISGTTFTGSSMTSTGTFTPSGSVNFTNTNQTATVSKAASGTATYTPEGTITAGAITVKTAGATGTIHNPTSTTVAKTVVVAAPGATAPSNALTYYSVTNETLSLYQLGYTTGDSITTNDVTVKTGDAAYESANPTFTGTGARLVTGNISVPSSAAFVGNEGNVSVSGTTTGSVSNGTFTGTGARLVTGNISVPSSATFVGNEGNVSVSGTTTGSVSNGTFTGTDVALIAHATNVATDISATFTGTPTMINVSPNV